VLLVGLGTPYQERWTQKHSQAFDGVFWGVGSLLEYYAGKPKAPRFLGKMRFEWLFRLLVEPRRLWQRYTWGSLRFIWKVICLKYDEKKIHFAKR